MKLSFRARPAQLCAWPNSHHAGSPRRYVGRDWRPGDRAQGLSAAYPASTEPATIDAADANAQHLVRRTQRGELYPADAETARHCGVPFLPLEQDAEGEWIPAATTTQKRRAAAQEKD